MACRPLGFSELFCWSLHERTKKVGVLYKNKSLGKLYLSTRGDRGGEVIQVGGKLLLRIEAVLNIENTFFFPHLKAVLYFTFSVREIHFYATCAVTILSAWKVWQSVWNTAVCSMKPVVTNDRSENNSSFSGETSGMIGRKLLHKFCWASAGFTVTSSDFCICFLFFQILKTYRPQSKKSYLMKYSIEMFRKVNES